MFSFLMKAIRYAMPGYRCALMRTTQITCTLLALLAAERVPADNQTHIYPNNPAIQENAIYVSAQGVTRFDRNTLEPVWQALHNINTLEPVATPGAILIATTRGLYALDPATGNKLWQLVSNSTLFPPAVFRSVAYVGGADGSLRAVALDSGHVLWRRSFDGWLYTPAIVNGKLVVGGKEGILRAIDVGTGNVLWEKVLDQELVYRPVEVPGGGVVATLFNGKVLMVNADDGTTRWQAQDQTPSFSPAVTSGVLYFGGFDGSLKARSQQDGRILWQQRLRGRLHLLPQVVEGVILVGSDQAELAAYDAITGRRLWHHRHEHELVASPVVLNKEVIAFTVNDLFSQRASFLSRR